MFLLSSRARKILLQGAFTSFNLRIACSLHSLTGKPPSQPSYLPDSTRAIARARAHGIAPLTFTLYKNSASVSSEHTQLNTESEQPSHISPVISRTQRQQLNIIMFRKEASTAPRSGRQPLQPVDPNAPRRSSAASPHNLVSAGSKAGNVVLDPGQSILSFDMFILMQNH